MSVIPCYIPLKITVHITSDTPLEVTLLGTKILHVQSNSYLLKRKPVIIRRMHVWFIERMLVKNPAAVRTRIKKETKRFSCILSSLAVDML